MRRFLDLEARVEEEIETDEDEEADLDDGFIDHSGDEDFEGGHQARHRDVHDVYDAGYDELLASAYNRASASARTNYRSSYAFQTEVIIGHPGEDEYPLWRVECRIGYEEYIVAYLLEAAQPYHKLRSVSMRGSIRGCVYLECQMNPDLTVLLKKTPGIKQTRQGIRFRRIENADYVSLFTMRDSKTDFAVGNWVTIKKGLYKGDIGLISGVETWGVEVLLVPRSVYRLLPVDEKRKRKATTIRPPADLFDAAKVEEPLSHKLIDHKDGSYTLGHLFFVHGLLSKPYNYASIGLQATHMPWSQFACFILSEHPSVFDSRPPRPLEWSFVENNRIVILSSGKQGVIVSAEASYAEVAIPSEGTHLLPWYDMQKLLVEGDYVRIISGSLQGQAGWVTGVKDVTAMIMIESTETEDKINSDTFMDTAKHVEVHVNCVVVTEPPVHFAVGPLIPPTPHEKHTRHPWCDTSVIISKLGHGRKGQTGIIKDVLLNQPTASGLMLVLQLSRFDPVSPFRTITIDNDYVVELKTQKSLLDFFKSKGVGGNDKQQYAATVAIDYGGSATPMPIASSSTPAWDPSSQTPLSVLSPESSPQINTDSTSSSLQHILLHPSFLGVTLNVIANGGRYKNQGIPATISMVDGHLALRHIQRGTSYPLEPDWITPKHPSPTHDNGLVLVIQGDHHGKYLRRLYHDGYGRTALMIAAVVERVEGSVDHITGEQLKIDCDCLCTVKESDAEVKRMKKVMEEARITYRAKLRS